MRMRTNTLTTNTTKIQIWVVVDMIVSIPFEITFFTSFNEELFLKSAGGILMAVPFQNLYDIRKVWKILQRTSNKTKLADKWSKGWNQVATTTGSGNEKDS